MAFQIQNSSTCELETQSISIFWLFLGVFLPLQFWFSHTYARLRLKAAKKTDQRVKLMNEVNFPRRRHHQKSPKFLGRIQANPPYSGQFGGALPKLSLIIMPNMPNMPNMLNLPNPYLLGDNWCSSDEVLWMGTCLRSKSS